MRLGLLSEAVQTQQSAASAALERLREHTAGLDAVVREEIRGTLIEELAALGEETRAATAALRALQRAAGQRQLAWGVCVSTLAGCLPLALGYWLLPSRAELATLRASREQLSAEVAQLSAQGGRAELRHCGAARRLCVRVDRSAPPYGAAADFRVLQGY